MTPTAEHGEELRIFGPPGTGKTTWISHQVRRSAEKRGSDRIIVASFTRAAAEELGGRNLPIPSSQLGTLHALCYRALDRPRIAQGQIDDWNTHAPHLRLSGGSSTGDVDEAAYDQHFETPGDQLLSQIEILRAGRIPEQRWPVAARAFHTRWSEWKRGEGLLDFTDLIETALTDVPVAPGSPEIGFFDEVQDFTPLELDLVRRWGRSMERYLLAGDDDQCLYRFKGSRPDAFLDPPLPDRQKRVLAQSHRVPAAVHQMAQAWVLQLTRREPKDYRPRLEDGREAPGRVRLLSDATWRAPEAALDDAEREAAAGRTVMLLASCAFMLDPLKAVLRERGLPFHNPYRRKRGDWNPLAVRGEVTAVDRLLAFLRDDEQVYGDGARPWNWRELHAWVDVLRIDGMLKRGAKTAIAREATTNPTGDPIADPRLFDWFVEEELEHAMRGDVDWWERRLLAAKRNSLLFPIQVHRRRGAQALMEVPQIIIGTMHSVKGGQADVVYLFPDLSNAGMREWMAPGEPRDSVVRQMYVGMTRAREQLVLCGPASGAYADMRRHAMRATEVTTP